MPPPTPPGVPENVDPETLEPLPVERLLHGLSAQLIGDLTSAAEQDQSLKQPFLEQLVPALMRARAMLWEYPFPGARVWGAGARRAAPWRTRTSTRSAWITLQGSDSLVGSVPDRLQNSPVCPLARRPCQ